MSAYIKCAILNTVKYIQQIYFRKKLKINGSINSQFHTEFHRYEANVFIECIKYFFTYMHKTIENIFIYEKKASFTINVQNKILRRKK